MSDRFKRTVEELHERASMFWPSELSVKEANLSVIPELEKTQDDFIAVLGFPAASLEDMLKVLESVDPSKLTANMFLKHLVVLADFGGEKLERLNSEFSRLFPSGELVYLREEREYRYRFKKLPVGRLSNDKLGVSAGKLFAQTPLNELQHDVIAILLFGADCVDKETANVLQKCRIGDFLGQPYELEEFVRKRYIWVSRITGGSQANTLGQIAQTFVSEYLESNIGLSHVDVKQNSHLPGVIHTDDMTGRPTSFDLVVSRGEKRVAIEISFQETTNSTIERKGGQARSRFEQVENAGYKIAYVIDGAGNFQRVNAIRNLASHSHCTVAFSEEELSVLCEFLGSYLSDDNE